MHEASPLSILRLFASQEMSLRAAHVVFLHRRTTSSSMKRLCGAIAHLLKRMLWDHPNPLALTRLVPISCGPKFWTNLSTHAGTGLLAGASAELNHARDAG